MNQEKEVKVTWHLSDIDIYTLQSFLTSKYSCLTAYSILETHQSTNWILNNKPSKWGQGQIKPACQKLLYNTFINYT